MSSHIRALEEKDFKEYVELVGNAYPGWRIITAEDKQKLEERLLKTHREDPAVAFFGYFRDGKLLGGMRFHHFDMNYSGVKIKAGGLGLVAVGLPYKKEKVAKEMVLYFLRYFREKGVAITMLYPFRPDFYKQMGFGFGTKMNQYRIKPKAFPKGNTKRHVRLFDVSDRQQLLDCHNRFALAHHGMIEKTQAELDNVLSVSENKLVVYKAEGKIRGYMLFTFRKAAESNLLINDIFVKEFIYENRDALEELLTFLHSQEDQINRVVFNTPDESFHHLFSDPLDGRDNLFTSVYHETNIQGVGLMYRMVDTKALFCSLKDHNFNGQSCKLRISLRDDFLEDNNGTTVIHFIGGKAHTDNDSSYEAEMQIGISALSSFIMGTVSLKALLDFGLAGLSDESFAPIISDLFVVPHKPYCTTLF